VWWFRITLLYTKGHPIFKSSLKKAKLQGRRTSKSASHLRGGYGKPPYGLCW